MNVSFVSPVQVKEEAKSEAGQEESKQEHDDNDDITEIPVPVVVHPVVDVHESDVEADHEHDSITLNESKDEESDQPAPGVLSPKPDEAPALEESLFPFNATVEHELTDLPMMTSRLTPPPAPSSLLTCDVAPPSVEPSMFSPVPSPAAKSPSPEKEIEGETLLNSIVPGN